MFGFLLAVLLLDGLFLTVIVLLQSGKGDGLAAMGGGGAMMGTDSLIGGRQAVTLLTKSTWVAGGLFLALSLVLSVMSSRSARPESILQQEFQTTPVAPQPILPGAGPESTVPQNAAPPTTSGSAQQPPPATTSK